MQELTAETITQYLRRLKSGDPSAVQELLPHVYADLQAVARRAFRDKPQHTLQPTALVHEAYLRMVKSRAPDWKDRKHFLRVAAMAMRQLLADRARRRNAEKRGGGQNFVQLEGVVLDSVPEEESADGVDLDRLDEALEKLQRVNPRQAEIVQMRYLAGLTVEEVADVLDVSERLVFLEWKMAKAWLLRELDGGSES